MIHYSELNRELGNIDLYLLDQILKGRFEGKNRIMDAGCGEGRNLRYFVNNGFEVYGADPNAMAVRMAQMTYKNVSKQNWFVSRTEHLNIEKGFFDAVICSAVLHFSIDENHFYQQIESMINMLKSGGLLFIRMASNIGLSNAEVKSGFNFFLTTEIFDTVLERYPLELLEPLKSVIVDHQRSMATLVMYKK